VTFPNPDPLELDRQKALLQARVGPPGSGAVRYAAAMYFYSLQLIPVEMLEIYRRCSKFDDENPIDLANYEGVHVRLLEFTKTPRKKA
jgi:hypothetical protein